MNDTALLSQVDDKGEGRAMLRLIGDTSGVTAIEYALIAGFVAVAAGAIFPATLMPDVSKIFSKL